MGNSFTKDLSAYFTADFLASSAVALVNFPDLEPGGGSPPGGGLPEAPTYSGCRVMQGQLIQGLTQFWNLCSATSGPGGGESGQRIVGDEDMDVCGGNGRITVLPFGGTLTSGLDVSSMTWTTNSLACPGDWDSVENRCNQKIGRTYGIITMNSVMVDSKSCSFDYYGGGIFHHTITHQAGYNVCCFVDPLPSP